MGQSTVDRLKREKEFHNETFSSDTRKAAKKYYQSANVSKKFYKERVLTDVKGKHVLEYGCGPGSAAFDVAKVGGDVHAIDISDVAIEQALDKAKSEDVSIKASVMDAENLSFDNDSFDLVCGSGILHHLDLERSYKEIQRVLKPNGRAVFFEPLGHNPIINVYRHLTPSMRTDDEHPLLMSDLELAKNYFEEVKTKHFNLTATAASFVPALSTMLNRTDEVLFKALPFLKKHSWIVVIEFLNPR